MGCGSTGPPCTLLCSYCSFSTRSCLEASKGPGRRGNKAYVEVLQCAFNYQLPKVLCRNAIALPARRQSLVLCALLLCTPAACTAVFNTAACVQQRNDTRTATPTHLQQRHQRAQQRQHEAGRQVLAPALQQRGSNRQPPCWAGDDTLQQRLVCSAREQALPLRLAPFRRAAVDRRGALRVALRLSQLRCARQSGSTGRELRFQGTTSGQGRELRLKAIQQPGPAERETQA